MNIEQGEKLKTERYPFIAVVGAPGSGKSTLVEAFVEETKVKFLEEPYQDNPYLKGFYTEDPKKYAFDSQMYFLPLRGLQMRKARPILQNHTLMQDSTLEADGVMAKALRNMWFISDRDYITYVNAKKKIEEGLLRPDLTIFLRASKESVRARIIKRGREMELRMLANSPDYFNNLVDAFDAWYEEKNLSRGGVIPIDTNKFDVSNGPDSKAAAVRECSNWLAYYLAATHSRGLNGFGSDGSKLILPNFIRPDNRFRDFLPGEVRDR